MNKRNLADQLQMLGFDDTEATIYLRLLEGGPKTPLQLFRETGLNRSKVYRYVEKLKARGLVEEGSANWGVKIVASSPQNLNLLFSQEEARLSEQKKNLPSLISELSSLPTFVEREFEIKHYHGIEGLKQMEWNELAAQRELIRFSYQNRNDVVGRAFAEVIRQEQIDRKIKLFEIENETDQGDYWYTNVRDWGKYYESRYISPKTLKIRQNFAIFNGTVSIMNWGEGNQVGVEIINSAFAEMERQKFWKFWEILEPKKKKTKG